MPRLPPKPDLDWTPEGAPIARGAGDIYFSRAGGLAETEAVFLCGCGLPACWAGRTRFTILELGFGTGLNALAAWRAWAQTRAPGAVLHFISVEHAPLEAADGARALKHFPELAPYAARLIARWPVRARGPQRLWFEEDGFALTLLIDEARAALAHRAINADAVFLDGFSPARNASMWNAELIGLVTRNAAPDARLATYSVAGAVRRALEAEGWRVEKRPGFGAKRERLEAQRGRETAGRSSISVHAAAHGRIAILGAGIAGAALAHALKRRGREALLIEAAPRRGAGASGNPAALVMPRLDRGEGPHATLHRAAFIHAVEFYERLGALRCCEAHEQEGAREPAASADLLADPPLPEDWLRGESGRLVHARAGVVDPQGLLGALTHGIETRFKAQAHRLERAGDAWRIFDAADHLLADAEHVVLANGARMTRIAEAAWLPIRLSRGQLEFAQGASLGHARVAGAYVAPHADGCVFGATFDQTEDDTDPVADRESRARNCASLEKLAPELLTKIHDERILSRASLRATTPDRMPMLGEMPDLIKWNEEAANIAHGRARALTDAQSCLSGLYVFGGLGARGFTLAPLLAESLASMICDEPDVLSRDVIDAIAPSRFLMRALKRREGILS